MRRNRLTLYFHRPANSRSSGSPENGFELKERTACLTLRFNSGGKCVSIARRAAGCRAGRRPLPFPLLARMKRFAKDGFERHSLLTLCIKAFAPTALLH